MSTLWRIAQPPREQWPRVPGPTGGLRSLESVTLQPLLHLRIVEDGLPKSHTHDPLVLLETSLWAAIPPLGHHGITKDEQTPDVLTLRRGATCEEA